ESVALDVIGAKLVREVAPGELLQVDFDGNIKSVHPFGSTNPRPCIFEHVYFARPDSILDGVSVYKTRIRQGERLAAKIQRERPDHDIDVVIPIPDSSRVAGDSLARALGVKCREGLVKNRYVGRTFIMPGQKQRKKSVRQKLNPIPLEFEGKNVLLVDDSIVRGTTCEQLIHMAREAGAKRVYFASASPPVRHPNVYGIDMPTRAELVASGLEVDEIARTIGADWLVYQDLDDLCQASRDGNERLDEFDCSVFDGEYVTGDVTEEYLAWLAQTRSDAAKEKERGDED
ncbi:MAG: amidophosphoribosyltransferase, partial [Planctomycetota bacterium]